LSKRHRRVVGGILAELFEQRLQLSFGARANVGDNRDR
jgi:hypothetical protein